MLVQKYKLLKDLHIPMDEGYINIFPVGSVFEKRGDEYVSQSIDIRNGKSHDHWMDSTTIENNTEFFAPLIESEVEIEKMGSSSEYVDVDKAQNIKINELVDAVNALQKRK